jgi:hypothetical protein
VPRASGAFKQPLAINVFRVSPNVRIGDMSIGVRWMIPLATSGSVIAIAVAWVSYNQAHQAGATGSYLPLLAAATAAGGLTAASTYWAAPANQRSIMKAFVGGLLTAIVAAGAIIVMTITAFGS